MKHLTRVLSGSLLAAASLQAMACYTVYDRSNRVMYQGEEPPVDMSQPLHQTVAGRFPGGHMVFDSATGCQDVVAARPAPVPGGAPLLTDQHTAQAMRVPYTTMAGGIALVQPRADAMRPGLTVVPSTNFAAAPGPSRETVITEWRAPQGTTVETTGRRPVDSTRMMGAGPAPRR
ncbi:MAG: hypothetical protein Q8R01_16865 [Ramlibacter sp.]|nr:hypothetical protein [Ramlibacter sp.]